MCTVLLAALLLQAGPIVTIDLEGRQPLEISAADLASLPSVEVTVVDAGTPRVYAGVTVTELLRRAGFTFGRTLRGPALAQYLLAEGADGYRVVFALTEFDPDFTDAMVLVASRVDGKPLPADDGPLRLIVAREKRGARWVRDLKALRVRMAP